LNNFGDRFDKSTFSKRALKWSISIVLPSLILFGSNQILVTWNLSNLLTAVENSESSMKTYLAAAKVNKPGPGVEAKYWGEHGFDIEYIGPRDRWARENIVPAAIKYLPEIKENIAELEDMNLITFDQGMKLARESYIKHAIEWRNALEAIIVCGERDSDSYLWLCIDNYYYNGGDAKISGTWNSAQMEFARISPMLGLYNVNSRISDIFKD